MSLLHEAEWRTADDRAPDKLGWSNVAVASTLIFSNMMFSMVFGLGLERNLLTAATRCIIQLTIMGQILQPVFEKENPWFVSALASLLIFIAVLEITFNKAKFRHTSMFATVGLSTLLAVLFTSFIGSGFAFGSTPWWRPITYIPTLGMLLGNAMSGQAVGLNAIMGQATENKERIEMDLSFGASRWEAARPVVIEAIRTALLPVLNNMSVMGLISIPGMMTGSIMGGASINDAVKLQQVMIFMISGNSTIAVIGSCMWCTFIIFDERDRLRLDRIQDVRPKPMVLDPLAEGKWYRRPLRIFSGCGGRCWGRKRSESAERQPLLESEASSAPNA